MSTAPSPIVSIDRSHPSVRFRTVVGGFNRTANDPNSGGSIEDFDAVVSGGGAGDAHDDPKDLIKHLIARNMDIWTKLLENPFCKQMKTATKTDQQMIDGFKRYMIQDFYYLADTMVYDTERANKVKDADQFLDEIDEIVKHANEAKDTLAWYIDPKQFNIPEKDIFPPKIGPALKAYLEGKQKVAINEQLSWVETLVFMVPCIQSYYLIAQGLKNTTGIPKDTDWYKYFIDPNANPKWSIAQKGIFAVAEKDWKKDFESGSLDKIFREACQYEIDLWAVGL